MNNDLPLGGKVILIDGDFRQLLPVKINATLSELVNLAHYGKISRFFRLPKI